ncbi:MAG: nucleotide-binding protein [Candidatus Helarchaeota archaeon]
MSKGIHNWYDWLKLDKPVIGFTGGKGGTGKTTVAVNIAYLFYQLNKKVLVVDCDVDNPNVSLLLGTKLHEKEEVSNFIPEFNDNCTACGKCHEVCRAKAILNIPNKKPLLFPEICSGCKACQIICPENAVDTSSKVVGSILEGTAHNIDIIAGKLKIGEPGSAEVVKAVKMYALDKISKNDYDIIIIDTAPGAHCDVLLSLFGVKLVLYITEPTLYGTYDLKRIIKLVDNLQDSINSYIILNRFDMTDNYEIIENVSNEFNVPILGKIPLDRDLQIAYAKGIPVVKEFPQANSTKYFKEIFNKLIEVEKI